MANPPGYEQACAALLQLEITEADLKKKYHQLMKLLNDIGVALCQLKWGTIPDAIVAELEVAAGALAAAAAAAVAGAASSAIAALIEAFFASLMKIFLAAPHVVFSLVSIPQKRALKLLSDELVHLGIAEEDLSIVMSIILKWVGLASDDRSLIQMSQALPLIEKAINLTNDIILSIDVQYGSDKDAYFDESKFNNLKNTLDEAISITTPASNIRAFQNMTNAVNADRDRRYKEKSLLIDADYESKTIELTQKYQKRAFDINSNKDSVPGIEINGVDVNVVQTNVTAAMKESLCWQEYDLELERLNYNKKKDLAKAMSVATKESLGNKDNYKITGLSIVDEFRFDAKMIMDHLSSFLDNIGKAYGSYKASQLTCNTIYNIRSLIKGILNFLIKIIRAVSLTADVTAKISLSSSVALMEMARDKCKESVDKAASGEDTMAMKTALDLIVSNQLLIGADFVVNSMITKSLVDLINSPGLLKDSSGEFDSFIGRIAAIPDWDGSGNVWAVDPFGSKVSPYIDVMAKASLLSVKIPIAAVSQQSKAKKLISSSLSSVKESFQMLTRHNSEVTSAVGSYTPYRGEEAGNLEKILERAGILDSFASAMVVAGALTELLALSPDFNAIDVQNVNHKNCAAAFPDMYDVPQASDANAAAAIKEANVASISSTPKFVLDLEGAAGPLFETQSWLRGFNPYSEFDKEGFNPEIWLLDETKKIN